MPSLRASQVVDLEALAGAELAEEPYRWAYLRRAIVPAHAAELRASFPRSGFWHLQNHDGEKEMDFRIRPLVPLGGDQVVEPETLDPAWRRFAEELLGPAFREAFGQALGRSLEGALLEVNVWRWGSGAKLGPHVDIPRKLASEVFYFNERWDPASGGCLRVLRSRDPDDAHAELAPALGSASLIVRSEASWHAVPAVSHAASEDRLSVAATWQHPGTESPFWTTETDGTVWCHAKGATQDASLT